VLRNRIYYGLKPFVPESLRTAIRRSLALRLRKRIADVWPIMPGSERPPENWPGWPAGKKFAFVLTHDVEGKAGLGKCRSLMQLELELGFRSSFNFVPEGGYQVPAELREELTARGFEVGIHDLKHDGHLFASRRKFTRSAVKINGYAREWGASGFRSGFMLRNLDWLHDLEVEYDASTFDTDPFEPQPQGRHTIFPFWVPNPNGSSLEHQRSTINSSSRGYVELPYTLPQDFTLFVLLQEKTPEIWMRKLDWIAQHGGMVLVDVHPDYLCFDNAIARPREYPVTHYKSFLEYVSRHYDGVFWNGTPREVAQFCARVTKAATAGDPRQEFHGDLENAGVGRLATTPTGLGNCDQIGALITGADYRALGVVRSLGRRGIPVWLLKRPGHHLAAVSKYARNSEAWPLGDEAQGVDFMLDLAERKGIKGWVLIPTDDAVVGLVARHHDVLAKQFCLTIPPWDKLSWFCDKRQLNKLARDLKVDQPWTLFPRDREEVTQLRCSFPVIIKPALREAYNPLTAAKAWRIDDRPSLIARYDKACSMMAPELIMIQEVIPGWGEAQFSYAALCQDGRPLASIVARRSRQYPMDFGQFSTYVETINDPGVVQPSVRLLEAARYTGLVEVEFKRDPRDGRFKVLDVNPRVWGWHTLGSRVGVDFSYLLWRMVRGEAVPEVHGGPGARWIRMNTDFPIAILEIMRGRLSLGDYLRSLRRPFEPAVFATDDPLPGLLELPRLIYLFFRRRLPWSDGF
jgi:D-aspartate ligase